MPSRSWASARASRDEVAVLMTREYNFVTYYSELDKDDRHHGLQYAPLLWERK